MIEKDILNISTDKIYEELYEFTRKFDIKSLLMDTIVIYNGGYKLDYNEYRKTIEEYNENIRQLNNTEIKNNLETHCYTYYYRPEKPIMDKFTFECILELINERK